MGSDGRKNGFAIASVVLGVVSLGTWCLPCCCGTPLVVAAGITLGILGLESDHRAAAIAGIALNAIGALLIVANMAYGMYLGATGEHDLVNRWMDPGTTSPFAPATAPDPDPGAAPVAPAADPKPPVVPSAPATP